MSIWHLVRCVSYMSSFLNSILLILLKDQYGNYVMQKALDCADTGGWVWVDVGMLWVGVGVLWCCGWVAVCGCGWLLWVWVAGCFVCMVSEHVPLSPPLPPFPPLSPLTLSTHTFATHTFATPTTGQGKSMVYRIRPHLPILRKYTYAKHMVIKIEKILTRSGSFW